LFYIIPAAYFLNKESREGKEEGGLILSFPLSLSSPSSLFKEMFKGSEIIAPTY
jgi:hypothetical protein